MALAEVAIPITFVGGVDTETDPKSVATTQLLALENGVFTHRGSLGKRTGYAALSKNVDGNAEYSNAKSLAVRGTELVLFADGFLYSHRSSTGTWSKVGRAPSVVHTEMAVAATGSDQSMPDAATRDGISVFAWEDSRGGVWWSISESATARVLRPPAQLDSAAQCPRVITVGSAIHIYYAVPAAGRIYSVVVNQSSYLSAVAPSVLVDDLSTTNPSYDAEVTTRSGTPAVIAWARAGGGYRVGFVDASGVLGSSITGHPGVHLWADTVSGAVAVAWSSEANSGAGSVAVTWVDSLTVRVRMLDDDTLSSSLFTGAVFTTTLTAVRVASAWRSGTTGALGIVELWMWAEEPDAAAVRRDHKIWYGYLGTAGLGGISPTPLRGHGLVSRGFVDGTDVFVIVAHEVPFFPYAIALRFAEDPGDSAPGYDQIGRLLVGTSDGIPTRGHVATVATDPTDARVHRWAGLAREQVDAASTGSQFTETGLQIITLDFDHDDAYHHAEFGSSLVIGGAIPLRYDGDTVAELGFHSAPDGIMGAVGSAGGSLTASSTYLYGFAYEEVDAQGEIHIGPMSVGLQIALQAGETRVTLTITTYRLTAKRNTRIGVYRTEANDESDSPDMFRVSSLNPSLTTGSNRYVDNDTTVDYATFVDDMSDITLLTRERAYTNFGVLSNDPVGLGAVVASGKGRLFWTDPSDSQVVRYTQQRRDGYGPEVSADLSIRFDVGAGDIGALAVFEDYLIAFKSRSIEFVAGPGPLRNPDAAPQIGFSAPQQLPSEVGCVASRSVAVTSDRVFFQAALESGIYQIDRGRSVSYVGEPVESYNNLRIVSADAIPGRDLVAFLTASGKTLVYDLRNGQWSTWTNHDGLDSVVAGGVYHYLRANTADGRVFRSDPGFLDAGLAIPLYLETAWIKMSGLHQGLQRIWYALLLGEWKSSHVLEVRIATDYRPGWGEPISIAVDGDYDPAVYGEGAYGAGPFGGSSDSVYQQRIHVGAKCQAIRFAIGESNTPPPQGASFELTELLLTGGVMRPSARFGAGRTQ